MLWSYINAASSYECICYLIMFFYLPPKQQWSFLSHCSFDPQNSFPTSSTPTAHEGPSCRHHCCFTKNSSTMFRHEGKKITHLGTTLQLWQQQRALGGFDSDAAGDGAAMPTEKLLSEQRKCQHSYSSTAWDPRGSISTKRLSKFDSTRLLKPRYP